MTDWRTHLSDPPKPHSLRDLVLLILDMADEDANALAGGEEHTSARDEFEELLGYNVYDLTRQIMEAFPDAPKFDDEREALAKVIDDAADAPVSQTPRDFQAYELTVDMLEDLLVTVGATPSGHGVAIRKTAGALVYKIGRRLAPEPQGEPSDAQVLAALDAYLDGPLDRNERMRAALRAASAVTDHSTKET